MTETLGVAMRSQISSNADGFASGESSSRSIVLPNVPPLEASMLEVISESMEVATVGANTGSPYLVPSAIRSANERLALVFPSSFVPLRECYERFVFRYEAMAVLDALFLALRAAASFGVSHRFLSPDVIVRDAEGGWRLVGAGLLQGFERLDYLARAGVDPNARLSDPYLTRTAAEIHREDVEGFLRICAWLLLREPTEGAGLISRLPWLDLARLSRGELLALFRTSKPFGAAVPRLPDWCAGALASQQWFEEGEAVVTLAALLGVPSTQTTVSSQKQGGPHLEEPVFASLEPAGEPHLAAMFPAPPPRGRWL